MPNQQLIRVWLTYATFKLGQYPTVDNSRLHFEVTETVTSFRLSPPRAIASLNPRRVGQHMRYKYVKPLLKCPRTLCPAARRPARPGATLDLRNRVAHSGSLPRRVAAWMAASWAIDPKRKSRLFPTCLSQTARFPRW